MGNTDLAHAAFAVKVERTLEFYAHLGIREAFRRHHDDGSLMLVYLHVAGDRFIEIFPGGLDADAQRKGSFMHLCLLTEVRSAVETLRSAGVPIDRESTTGLDTNLQAWTNDPDGNATELMQLSPNSPQRRIARGEVVG